MTTSATVKVRRRWTVVRQRRRYVQLLEELAEVVCEQLGIERSRLLSLEADVFDSAVTRRREALLFVRALWIP